MSDDDVDVDTGADGALVCVEFDQIFEENGNNGAESEAVLEKTSGRTMTQVVD